MKAFAKLLLAPLLLLALMLGASGCVELTMLMKVNPDGSGVIRMRTTVSPEQLRSNMKNFQASAQRFQEEMQAQGTPGGAVTMSMTDAEIEEIVQKARTEALFNREALQQIAASLGEGVRLARAKEIEEGSRRGFLAEFAFTDVTKLRLEEAGTTAGEIVAKKTEGEDGAPGGSAMPGGMGNMGQMMGGMAGGITGGGADLGSEPLYRIEFSAGTPARLTLVPLKDTNDAPPPQANPDMPGDGEMPPEMQAQMMQMMGSMVDVMAPLFEGIELGIYLQANGTIDQTNATHRMQQRPNTVTLLYTNLGQLVSSFTPDMLMQLSSMPETPSFQQFMEMGLRGLKMQNPEQPLSISFR